VCNVQDLGNFGSSDHKLIFCNLGTDVDIVNDFKTRFDHNRMDINGLRDEIRLVNWMSVLTGSVEDCWSKFKSTLLDKDKDKVPWMNYKALKWIKKNIRFLGNIRTVVTRLVEGCLK